MNSQKSAFPVAFLGATGAVGGEVLKTLTEQAPEGEVRSFGRRKLDPAIVSWKNIQEFSGDIFSETLYSGNLEGCKTAICTLGMGQPSKVSPEEFYRVDFGAVMIFARACREAWVESFSILTAVGTDATSRYRYLRIKWELEEAVARLGFESVRIFQPSMIMTPINRYGFTQYLTLKLYPFIDPLLVGPLKPFRSIKVEDLGRAMALDSIQNTESGVKKITWEGFHTILDLKI